MNGAALRPIVVSHSADPHRATIDGVTIARCGAFMPARASSGDPVCLSCRRALGLVSTDPDVLTCRRCGEDRLVELEATVAYCAVCGYAWRVRA